MNLILLLGQSFRHWNQRFQAHDPDHILLILRKLSENRQYLLKNMAFIKLTREQSKSHCARSSNHGRVLVAEFNEFLPQLFFLLSSFSIATLEKLAGAMSHREIIT